MLRIILNKIDWYKRVLLTILNIKRKYDIKGYKIKLDYTHLLPDYKNDNPYYDSFLPHLVKYLPAKSLVIDVGANVGDTLAGMIANNDKIQYLCVEADDDFFNDLKKNVGTLSKTNTQLKIILVKEFVGKSINDVSLDGAGGTKHAVLGSGVIKSKTMFDILTNCKIEKERISLLKTDVDGFDWDVLRSSYNLLSHHPYIFFECQYSNLEQLENYKDIFSELISLGYSKFAFFDNYGQYICATGNIAKIFELLDYVKRQNFYSSTRTIFYYDVFAYPLEKDIQVMRLINDYNTR
jgi:FkbM family methyltransferase